MKPHKPRTSENRQLEQLAQHTKQKIRTLQIPFEWEASDDTIATLLGTHFGKHNMLMMDARPLYTDNNYCGVWTYEFRRGGQLTAEDIIKSRRVALAPNVFGRFKPSKDLAKEYGLCIECCKAAIGSHLHTMTMLADMKCDCDPGGAKTAAARKAKADEKEANRNAAQRRLQSAIAKGKAKMAAARGSSSSIP